MFGWLKRRAASSSPIPVDPRGKTVIEQWLGPAALLLAITNLAKSHYAEVKMGRRRSPAYQDRDAGVLGMWKGIRLEALARMFGFGTADLNMLATPEQQAKLIRCFLEERPHLEMPQPRGEVLADTVQALWQIYVYLSEAGTAAADRETDRFKLSQKENDILTSFTNRIKQVQLEWMNFEDALRSDTKTLPALPATIIEVLYADVTKKSKSIALSSTFGPGYERGFEIFRKRLAHKPTVLKEFDDLLARILKANDPDDVSTMNA